MRTEEQRAADWLLSAQAVRAQSATILAAAHAGRLRHFAVDAERLPVAAGYVAAVLEQNYPDLDVPYHARWRHFVVDGVDRWAAFAQGVDADPLELARMRIGLAIVSVLLDAGAGETWQFADSQTGRVFSRSEGLAIASLEAFCGRRFCAPDAAVPGCDGRVLHGFSIEQLAEIFQVSDSNPLDGLDGRLGLLNRLGEAVVAQPQYFGPDGRLGNLADHFVSIARDGTIAADRILGVLLAALGQIWPGRLSLAGRNLGDCWRHPAAHCGNAADGYVPFHKLSQWLSYSMVEPLCELGLKVTGLDELTGLAEYRNGGLLIDTGVLVPKHEGIIGLSHPPDSEVIVEWRALTVALLDELAPQVRAVFAKTPNDLPLASVLEGGTWAAGRQVAAELREGGPPPLNIISDGSVF